MDRHSLYSGYNGSGKSYGVMANVVIPAIEQGISICTNLEFTDEFYDKYPDCVVETFTIEDVITPDGKPHLEFFYSERFDKCSLFVLDEAQEYIPSSLTARDVSQKATTFFNKIRHRVVDYSDGRRVSTQIVYLTPCADRLAKFVRGLISVTYLHKKLDYLGMSKSYRVDIYHGTVPTDTTKKATRTLNGSYRSSVYSLYRSQTGLEGAQGVDHEHALELTADPRKRLIKGIIVRSLGGLFILFLSLYYVFSTLDEQSGGYFSGDTYESGDTYDSEQIVDPSDSSSPGSVNIPSYVSSRPEWLPPHIPMPSSPHFDLDSIYIEGLIYSTSDGPSYMFRDSNTGKPIPSYLIMASGFLVQYVDSCIAFLIHPDSSQSVVTCSDSPSESSTVSIPSTDSDPSTS